MTVDEAIVALSKIPDELKDLHLCYDDVEGGEVEINEFVFHTIQFAGKNERGEWINNYITESCILAK